MKNPTLFESERLTMSEARALTAASLAEYGNRYRHWVIAYSGGKDSSTVATLLVDLIDQGEVPKPETLTVLYADTRMELPPLQVSATSVLQSLDARGIKTRVVLPSLDERFFVYMFGRGVPPPKNRFRWCTPQLKIEPMLAALRELRDQAGEKLLMLTGVRLGESAVRDQRIVLSCSRDGAECGQGWFQEATPEAIADTLAPILHWRVCQVWDWLTFFAPGLGFPTGQIAAAYGGDEAQEINARTGCVGCNLASRDAALDSILRQADWKYLEPLKRLKPIYRELTKAKYRLRKDGTETTKDGSLVRNPGRLGPLTMPARRWGLDQVLAIQADVNEAAGIHPQISLINDDELQRIQELIGANTWPNRWTGEEITGDEPINRFYRDGSEQVLLREIGTVQPSDSNEMSHR